MTNFEGKKSDAVKLFVLILSTEIWVDRPNIVLRSVPKLACKAFISQKDQFFLSVCKVRRHNVPLPRCCIFLCTAYKFFWSKKPQYLKCVENDRWLRRWQTKPFLMVVLSFHIQIVLIICFGDHNSQPIFSITYNAVIWK